MTLHIILVENDRRLRTELAGQLERFGHAVQAAEEGLVALALVGRVAFDAMILGRMPPVMDAMAVLCQLRERGMTMPVLMLSATGTTMEKVEGLDAGADDYLVTPVDPLELNARLNALVRARRMSQRPADTIAVGDVVVSPSGLLAWRAGQALALSKIEFRLLAELARNAGSIVTRRVLVERVWGYDAMPVTNIVESHIRQLRLKLVRHGPDPIVTVRGMGYLLRG